MTRATRGRRFLAACCAVMIGLSGCSTPEAANPPPERPTVDVPQDRDEDAVVDALRRLDLCAVLAPLVPSGSHFTTPGPSYCATDGAALTVERLPSAERLRLRLVTIGDAKAYTSEINSTRGGASCRVWLPVSFTLAIKISTETGCDASAEVASGVVAALADPTTEAKPRWEACMALRTVPGLEVEVAETVDACSEKEGSTALELRYTEPAVVPPDGWQQETIDGVTVWTRPATEPPLCSAEWVVGPAVTSHADDDLVAVVRGDCGQVRHIVETLVSTLRKDPGEGNPQRPLLYRPDEPDQPFPGVCAYVDIPARDSCTPYVDTPVPPPDQLATTKDPNVSCAVAKDAVGRALGTQLRPVTAGDHCYFVAPERLYRITVTLWRDPLQGSDPPGAGARSTTIAGHPAVVESARDGGSHEVLLATTRDAGAPGVLRFAITTGILGDDRLPADVIAKVEPMLADIVRAHLS